MNKIDKFIKHYFGDVKTASPKYYKKLVEEINSITDQEDKWISVEDELPIEHIDCTVKLIYGYSNDVGYRIAFYDKIRKCWYEKIPLKEIPQVITIKIISWKYCESTKEK